MTHLPVPRDAPVPVPANAAMPPLPAMFADLPPSLIGDKLRENAALSVGLAAMWDWFMQCYPQQQCDICNRWVDARVHADHVSAHGPIDRFLARKLGMRVK